MSALTSDKIKGLFAEINTQLAMKDLQGELCVVGGAVMCLVFHSRESTSDVDAAFAPTKIIREIASDIAGDHDLPEDWLNDAVKGYLSDNGSFESFLTFSNLKIFCATAEYMLALKAISMRIGLEFSDEADIRYLLRHLNISSSAKALEVIATYFPKERIPQKTFYVLEELLPDT